MNKTSWPGDRHAASGDLTAWTVGQVAAFGFVMGVQLAIVAALVANVHDRARP